MPDRTIAPVPQWRQAVVSAVDDGPPPSVTLTLDGADVGPIRFLLSTLPVVGDVVWVVRNDSDIVVHGALADGTLNGPTTRVAQLISTADSSAIGTTETVVRTRTAPVVLGRIYRVRFRGQIGASANGNDGAVKIREDSISGTILQDRTFEAPGVLGQVDVEAEYTADATETKTFVITLDLVGGAGTVNLDASATSPDHFTVDYIRG